MMSEKLANLVKMANQIAANICRHQQDDDTIAKVTNHLKLFWARSMKQEIIAYNKAGGQALSPEAQKAIAGL